LINQCATRNGYWQSGAKPRLDLAAFTQRGVPDSPKSMLRMLFFLTLFDIGCASSSAGNGASSPALYQCNCGTMTDVYVTTSSECGIPRQPCKLLGHLVP